MGRRKVGELLQEVHSKIHYIRQRTTRLNKGEGLFLYTLKEKLNLFGKDAYFSKEQENWLNDIKQRATAGEYI